MKNTRKHVLFSIQLQEKAMDAVFCLQISCSTAMKKAGKFKTALAFTVCLTAGGNVMAASFVDEVMEGVLGGMTNVTTPGAYEAANRGVFSGGSFFYRSKIFDPKIVTFVPPGYRAGCGGIDLFGGSFSFINADQLVQLFRSIAANAVGLLFQMALAVVCSECSTLIQKFQDIVRELNSMLKNSCEIADGLVTNTANAIKNSDTLTGALGNMVNDMGDAFQSFTNSFDGGNDPDPRSARITSDPTGASEDNAYGNIVWKAILDTGLPGRYLFSGDDAAEILMSVTGTIVIEKPTQTSTPSASGSGSNNIDGTSKTKTMVPRIELKDFLYGSENNQALVRYRCSDGTGIDQCLDPKDQDFTFDGYKKRLYKSICGVDLGSPCTGGLVRALASNNEASGNDLSADQKALLLSLPNELGSDFSKMATMGASMNTRNPSAYLGAFVAENIGAIALVSAKHTIDSIFSSVLETLTSQRGNYAQQAIKELQGYQTKIYEQYLPLEGEVGSLSDLRSKTQQIVEIYSQTPASIYDIINSSQVDVAK